MTLIAWATLIILAFIFIFVGLALIIFFTFYFNDGTSPVLGLALFLLAGLIIAVILPKFTASPIIPATVIGASFLVAFLGSVAHFLLPYLDNKDLIIAFRPIILFSVMAGVLVAVFNLAKIFII